LADIFVSYSRQDKPRVAPLVAALEASGWSVWWDTELSPGEEFDQVTAAELDRVKAVVVIWTPISVASRWVRGEARVGADRGVLVPVRFENAQLPIDVRAIHTTDLDDWGGDARSPAFQKLAQSLAAIMNKGAPPRAPAAVTAPTPTTPPITPPKARLSPKLLLAGSVLVALLVFAAAALFAWQPWHHPAKATGAPAATQAANASIAVLPFADLSEAHDKAYFADGVAEEILNALAQLDGLHVVGRTSSFAFRDKQEDLRAIAQALGVTTILEGSVRSAGDHLRVTAQLISAADGFHLWSETFRSRTRSRKASPARSASS